MCGEVKVMNEAHKVCPKFETAFQLLGKRWTGLIINVLLTGPKRFKQVASEIPQMSDRVLAERLKELEEMEIVTRHVYPETPVRIEYDLTDKGRDLKEVMEQVQCWADKWIALEKVEA